MNNKYYLATVLLVLGAFSPLYGVQNTTKCGVGIFTSLLP